MQRRTYIHRMKKMNKQIKTIEYTAISDKNNHQPMPQYMVHNCKIVCTRPFNAMSGTNNTTNA